MKIPFDPNSKTAIEAVREVIFERLRQERGRWNQLDPTGSGFQDYAASEGPDARRALLFHSQQIYVELLAQGIIAPGSDYNNLKLPFFHVTPYGTSVLDALPANPYFPTKYLLHLKEHLPGADATVLAYMSESLETFARGNHIAATVMLGIAAERVFLILCDSLVAAIQDTAEKKEFQQRLDRRIMKPKLDWVNQKFQSIRGMGFPDNAAIMAMTVYDLLRFQRNELGHPRETPPSISRPDAFVNLQVFPRYYAVAEQVRAFLATHQV
jgi:hypothetical protein